jgi:c-di-GMP-binding flagellar brake protein YcgR
MSNPNYDLLQDAIARNAAAVLALPSAGMIRHHKTRFLAETENGFWMECEPQERPLIESLMVEETMVGVAFKSGTGNVGFTSPILQYNPHFPVNEVTLVEAVFLPFPENFRQLQRRQAYRVTLPKEHGVKLRIWHIPEHAILRDRPLASREILVRLQNMSVLGLSAVCRLGRDGKPASICLNERLRILISRDGRDEILTEGRAIHFHPSLATPDEIVLGLQFKKLEKHIEGRQTISKLTELVGDLQREEVKRRRAMSLAG